MCAPRRFRQESSPKHCGAISVTVRSVRLRDLMGITSVRKKVGFSTRITVLPAILPVPPSIESNYVYNAESSVFSREKPVAEARYSKCVRRAAFGKRAGYRGGSFKDSVLLHMRGSTADGNMHRFSERQRYRQRQGNFGCGKIIAPAAELPMDKIVPVTVAVLSQHKNFRRVVAGLFT